ncbi:uncharacterized protein LOC142163830 [Nicotiana tabacum]|uniref:Uncharacterized protein LOC142163830 n=1 Tax=Nicotiana tabacum TaxID=4097 RepID=A0AC58RWF1_TOBAC
MYANNKIWLFLDSVMQWELVIDTEQQLTTRVYHQDNDKYIMMTFVYAKCSALDRLELWDSLYYLVSNMKLPWLVGGVFNVLLSEEEKIGGLPVYPPEYEDFAFYVNSCELFDTGVVHDRLEKILPSLISSNQSGFVKGRSIFENIMLTEEIVTDIRLREKSANVVIKLDMAKAYDRVSWKYLMHVFRKMGFAECFINMIWNLISNN